LTLNELPDTTIEISVLTPLKKIKDISEVEVGRHGIFITKDGNSGVLLPQVATEYDWDRDTFLAHTCLKAGLSPYCWKEELTEIYIFEAEVFREDRE
ncbi:MAG: TIGR00296 family protein, partial [Thermodesulfobacteriota bacterium]